jgi:hypothetical protein
MHGHRTRAAMAFPAPCAALALAGCGGTGAAGGSQATGGKGTTQDTTQSTPPPVTPAERRWLKVFGTTTSGWSEK